ncbi:MAG TPA: tetratricopeptide repeat protein [Verrucomicrobiae bacterium]|nr:tetratricopeptide repeat protein [Verrucomicrobiae bacterium]
MSFLFSPGVNAILAAIFFAGGVRHLLRGRRFTVRIFYGGLCLSLAGVLLNLFGAVEPFYAVPPKILCLGSGLFWTGLFFTIVCAASDLVADDEDAPEAPAQPAIFQLVLACLLLFASPFVAFRSMTSRMPVVPKVAASASAPAAAGPVQPADRKVYEFPQYNLRYTSPAGPWMEYSFQKVSPITVAGFFRADPAVYIQIIAESGVPLVPGFDSTMADQVYGHNIAGATQHKQVGKEAFEVGGIKGSLFKSELTFPASGPIHRVHWLGGQNGFYYQIIVWSSSEYPLEKLMDDFRGAAAGFQILDKDKTSLPASLAEDFVSEKYHYKVHAKDKGWDTWWLPQDEGLALPDFKITKNTNNLLLVYPVAFWDRPAPPLAIVAPALLQFNKIALEGVPADGIKPISQPGFEGYDIRYTQPIDGKDYFYRVKVLRGDSIVYLIISFNAAELGKGDPAILEEGLNMVEVAGGPPPKRETFTPAERDRHAYAYLRMAEEYFHKGKKAESLELLRMAHAFKTDDAVILESLLTVLQDQGLYGQGFAIAEKYAPAFPKHLGLRKLHASLAALAGENKRAAELYEALIAEGNTEREILEDYADVMEKMGGKKKAYEKLAALAGAGGTGALGPQSAVASFLNDEGQVEQGLDIYKKLYEKHPLDSEVRTDYFWHLMQQGRYQDVINVTEDYLKNHPAIADVHFYQGYALAALKKYPESRAAFVRARDSVPDSEPIEEYVDGMGAIERQAKGLEPGGSSLEVARTLEMKGEDLHVTEKLLFRKGWAGDLQNHYAGLDDEKTKLEIKVMLHALYGKVELQDVNIKDMEIEDDPFEIEYSYDVKKAFQKIGSRLYAALPQIWENKYLWPQMNAEYQIPLALVFPAQVKSSVTFHFPSEYQMESTMAPGTAKGQDPCLRSQTAVTQKSGELKMDSTYEFVGGAYTIPEYEACQEAVSQRLQETTPKILLSR